MKKKAFSMIMSLLLAVQLLPVPMNGAEAAVPQTASVQHAYPAKLKADAGDGQVALAWTAASGASSYSVKRGTANGGPYTVIASNVTTASYVDEGAANNTAYYYVVSAMVGGSESYISNQVKAIPYAAAAGVPARPSGLSAIAFDGSVELAWDAAAGADSYTVKRSQSAEGPYTAAASNVQGTIYKDTSVANGRVYYYTVAAVNDKGESVSSNPVAVSPARVIVVSQDEEGGGDFSTIQAAVDSISTNNTSRIVIYVAAGTYRERVNINKPYISLVGAGKNNTKIVYDLGSVNGSALNGATVTVTGNYFTADNITFENDAPPEAGQALALLVNADQAEFNSIRAVGYQDTLYVGIPTASPRIGRQYFRDSEIIGKVDYIYGPATAAVFDNVNVISLGNGGYVTAAATKNTTDPGIVFINSRLAKADDTTKGSHYLGRPWQDFPNVRFINTWMDDHIHPQGWTTMQVKPNDYAEFGSYGPGASPNTRRNDTDVPSRQMTAAEAQEMTIPRMFNGWDPTERTIIPLISPQVKLDTAPGQPDGENGVFTRSVIVSLQLLNNDSGANQAEYRIDGGAWTSYAAEFEVSKSGVTAIDYRLIDANGQPGTTRTYKMTIDYDARKRTPAFPGAEGAAMYATGGRGQDVYEVTSLADYDPSKSETPIPGSLRDAVSQGNRTVVFRVSGTIQLKNELKISQDNLTIAGQTAPGDGIAISGYTVGIGGNNLIVRYLRFRNGISKVGDSANFGGDNIIVDHCSFSWSTDETLSLKERENITVQWSIVSNSLNMSIHGKGAHGYGGIWGGTNVTYHHNLIVNHNSRNPRFDRQVDGVNYPTKVDFRNNVVYNWGSNTAYGGEYATAINMINNYYKPGPSSFPDTRTRLVSPSLEGGSWYIDGNVLEGFPEQSTDNWKESVRPDRGLASITRLTTPANIPDSGDPIGGPVATETAEEAYLKVIAGAGAILPKRDSLDARIINDMLQGKGRLVNTIESDGGLPVLNSAPAPVDTDHDGMPDAWELDNNLNLNDAADGKAVASNGYTNVENYMNGIVSSGSVSPDVAITSPAMHQSFTAGNALTITAAASDKDGTISKVQFYSGSTYLGESTAAPYTFTWNNPAEGQHYLYAKAIDNTGTQTLSSVTVIYVNHPAPPAPWSSQDIGNVAIPGSAGASGSDSFTVRSSGRLGGSSDAFHFMHQQVRGNFEFTARMEFAGEFETSSKMGIMVRESLTNNAKAAFVGLTYQSGEGYPAVFMNRNNTGSSFAARTLNADNVKTPYWFKLIRDDNTFIGYISSDNATWGEVGRATISMNDSVYVGFALDAVKSSSNVDYANSIDYYNVELKRSAAFALTSPSTAAVEVPEFGVAGEVIDASEITITNNGDTVVNAEFMNPGAFIKKIPLTEGINTIVITSKNNVTFPGISNKKTIVVTYNKKALVITPVTTVPEVVSSTAFEFSASVNKAVKVSVDLNGTAEMDSVSKGAGEVFRLNLQLKEGPNTIVITAVDNFGDTAAGTYTVNYKKDWGTGLFTLSGLSLSDLNGNALGGLTASQDTTVGVSINNNSAVAQSGVFVIALYDQNNKMVRYSFATMTIPAGGTNQAKAVLKLPNNTAGHTIKAFAWNNLSEKTVVSNVSQNP